MNRYSPLRGFVFEWKCYLAQRGHRVSRLPGSPGVLCSRNGRGSRFRWLLYHAEGSNRRLTAIEHETMQRHLRRARQLRERVFAVIKFDRPQKVIVMPAGKAARTRRLQADKGGIDWMW